MLDHCALNANQCPTACAIQLDLGICMFLAVEWTGRHVLLQLSSDISVFCFIYHKGSVVGCFLVHEVIVVAWVALKLTTCSKRQLPVWKEYEYKLHNLWGLYLNIR